MFPERADGAGLLGAPVTTLRPLQTLAIENIRALVHAGRTRILLIAPTGFGKTVVIAALVARHLSLHSEHRVLVVVHRRELVRQTVAKLHAAGVADVGVVQADREVEGTERVVVASLQTLASRGTRPAASMVIWDEAHHCPAASFLNVRADYMAALHIGATATPIRSDDKALGDMFEAMVVGASVRELTSLGLLVQSEVLAPGDMCRDLSMHPVEAYRTYTPGRAAVVFAASVAHARALVPEFEAARYRAACIDGETDGEVRDELLRRFQAGELDVITNCFVLTEGWDCDRASVAIIARSPEHVGTWIQMVGRILRPCAGKKIATVIDLRGAVHMLGLPDEDRRFSLTGKPCLRTETITALRRCTACLAVFRPARICPRCSAEHEVIEKIPRVLRRAEKLERHNDKPQAERDAAYFFKLVSIARMRLRMTAHGADDWAEKAFVKRFGRGFVRKTGGLAT